MPPRLSMMRMTLKHFMRTHRNWWKKHRQDRLIIYGDFNAKVGAGNKCDINGIYGIGRRNERGERLVEFCKTNSLITGNTLFKQHPRRTFTWTSPDGQTRNQTDYMLIQNRWKTSLKLWRPNPVPMWIQTTCYYGGKSSGNYDHYRIIVSHRYRDNFDLSYHLSIKISI